MLGGNDLLWISHSHRGFSQVATCALANGNRLNGFSGTSWTWSPR